MRNKYILLRHGQTIYQTKKDDFLYAWPDATTSLTKKGKGQIKAAAKKLKAKKIDLIYSSDFLRARQTAEIIAKELALKVKIDKRLRDINWGVYQDAPAESYLQFFSSEKQRFSKRPPKGENWRDVKKRTAGFIKNLEKKHKNKTILIVSHGDPLWLLFGTLKRLNENELFAVRDKKDFYPDVGQLLEI